MAGRVCAGVALAASVVVLAACVGPATTVAAYRGKSLRTANDALSQVQTVNLLTRQVLLGRVPLLYAQSVSSRSEDALSSIQGSYDSIQPPDHVLSDGQRDHLDTLLTTASGDVSDVRIALRRDDMDTVRQLLPNLNKDADDLRNYQQGNAS